MAIAAHEILAGLIPAHVSRHPAPREIVSNVTIGHIAVRPTPTPSPRPRPRIVSHTRTIAPPEKRAVPRTTSARAAPKQTVHRPAAAPPKPPTFTHAKPRRAIPAGGQGAGAGDRSGAGSLGAGNATGNGAGGNGNGAAAGNEPCGFVEFSDPHGSRFDPNTRGFWVDIRMTVHFPDGAADSLVLDYPWYYPNEASNPWSDRNLQDPNFPTTFQAPPPDKRASEPAIVQYVISHTRAGGYTLLKDCPAP